MRARLKTGVFLALLTVSFGYSARVDASPIYFGPSAYAQYSDSPLFGVSSSYSYLETFEDGLLNTPGVSASGGSVIGPDVFVDSVDGDDGIINGNGSPNGHSFYSNFSETSLEFTFDPLALGAFPTYAGIVLTDIGFNSPFAPWYSPVTFEAFDSLGASLGIMNPYLFGDGQDTGQTAEDRFFGVFNAGGISAFQISTESKDWEVDHLQYLGGINSRDASSDVPEPATISLVGLGAAAFVRNRFKNRQR